MAPAAAASVTRQIDLCSIDSIDILQAHLELPGAPSPFLRRRLCNSTDCERAGLDDNIPVNHNVLSYLKTNPLTFHRTSRANRLCKLEVNLRTIRNHGDNLCHWSGGNRRSDDRSRS